MAASQTTTACSWLAPQPIRGDVFSATKVNGRVLWRRETLLLEHIYQISLIIYK